MCHARCHGRLNQLQGLNNGAHCECDTESPDINQKCENKRLSQNLGKLTSHKMTGLQYTSFRAVLSVEEINYTGCNGELAIAHRCMSTTKYGFGSKETKSMNDNTETDHESVHLNPYCGAGTLVLEKADNAFTVSKCSEIELVQNLEEIDTTNSFTMCYECSPAENEIYSEEESGAVSITNKDIHLESQICACTTPQKRSGFTLDELSKGVMSFTTSNDDGNSRNEAIFGVLSSNRRDFNYSNNSFKAKIVGNSGPSVAYHETNKTHTSPYNQLTLPNPVASSSDDPVKKLVTGSEFEAVNVHHLYNTPTVVEDCNNLLHRITGYAKPVYPVLVENSVKVLPTNMFASLPQHNKFLVKERLHDPTVGFTRAKLVLKSYSTEAKLDTSHEFETSNQPCNNDYSEDEEEDVTSAYYRQNCSSPGRILYTCDRRFNGGTKWAVNSKIGKGGNGFVFTMYHNRKQYAVKKTVYRANEVNVHSALKHKNVLPLLAVLMGEKHERHHSKFYCFHFMPRMDCDLRQILSSKEIGCMKYFYPNCLKEPARWEKGFNNIKFVLAETLEALAYMHSNGFVHRDVNASNIMIKMRCHCRPLECTCSSKFQVKLGDFDSAGTIQGLGITEPTDQMIKFASILPLGTPGYRAPEVSMHIVLSGPYETLYTTAVDMWSFGCLCLNICIGKTAALKQREEASLLLSRAHSCSTELWEKTTKINELRKAKPFCNEPELIRLVAACLQVNSANRPSANDAIKMLHSV